MKVWEECSLATQIERWENCIRVLQSLTPHQRRKHWDMADFGYKTECGTIACAAGHCGMDPWFRRRGLRLTPGTPETIHVGYSVDVETFFGSAGSYKIFFDTEPRSVGTVIKECKRYVRSLKNLDQEAA